MTDLSTDTGTRGISALSSQIFFVFDNLPDWQSLAVAVPQAAELVVLEGAKDGLEQIAAHLQGRSGIDALHILSHGESGRVQLGSGSLGVLEAQARADLLERIGDALAADGDILLYGCDTASGAAGRQFIDQLAQLTRADVAASVDATGSALRAGNWLLEAHAGSVESAHLLAAQEALQGYAHLLAAGYSSTSNPLTAVSREVMSTIVGDFDGDGDVDVLTYNADFSGLDFHRNDGSGGFTSVDAADASSPFRDLMVTDHFHNAETTYVADFDNDGDLDIWDYAGNDHMLNAGPGVNGPGIYLRNDGGRYVRLADDDNPMKDMVSEQDLVIHGDFDGDGDEDLLAYKEGGLALGYYRNNGAGIFTEVAYENSPFGNIAAADQFFSAINTHVADFDGDGDLDIWDTTNGQAPVYLQNSGGTYVRLSGTDNPLQDVAWMIGYANGIVGDFDSDGDVDVLAYHSDGLTPEFLQNNGSGQFTVIAQADSPFAGIDQPYWNLPETYVADFDNDGDVDIWDYRGDGDSIYTQQLGAPPKLSDSNPLDDSTGVPADAPLVLHFNEIIAAVGSGAIRIHRSSDDALMQTIAAASTSVTGVGTQTITITPATPLVGLTGYYLLIDNQAFRDAQGMVFAGIADKTRLNFTTDTFNAAPVVNAPLPDSSATAGSAFNFQFAANAFVDIDVGDTLNYTAELTAGGALPAWLIFNPATRTFSGTPAAGDLGTLSIDVTADDGHGGTVTDTFNLVVTTAPPPPVTPPNPPAPAPVPVDGVPVVTTPGDGGTTIITIPVITSSRPDDPNSPHSDLADIPLVTGSGGRPILQVSVPVGLGLQAQGMPSPLTGAAALAELILRIERSGGGDPELTNNGQVFLATLDPAVPLTIQTITATAGADFNPGVPFVISGSTLSGDGMQAVILDARALPSGSTIQVDNVDFIAVVGNVRLVGGAGQNMASGDGAAQYIVLGADDDIIHGGGGNDTVGSKGGNDKIYGDAGDDTVFGGAGNDQLWGGSGSDRLNGGTGFDVAIQEGKRTDYTVTLEGAGIKLTHVASGVSDWLVDVEQLRFDTGPSLTIAHSAAEEAAAFLFQQWMRRDLTQSEGAVIQTLDGLSAVQVADLFAQVFPQQAGGRTAQQLLEGMAGAGAIRVDAPRETAHVGDAGDNSFSPTPGLAWTVDGGAGIDTIAFPATLAQLHVETSDKGFTLQRMTDGAMLELMNVERLTLSDTKLALDLDGHAGEAAKLIGAVGGAAFLDNKPLVGEVIRALDAGVSAQSLAQLGLQVLGAKTSIEVTQLLWTNVVGSAATPAQLQPFVDMMAQGVTGGELAVLASHLDLTATRIDLVGLSATGIEFA